LTFDIIRMVSGTPRFGPLTLMGKVQWQFTA
jgi:hypothetical protein